MPEYADIYALGNERKPEAVVAFLDRFLPDRIESADEYEVPQFSRDPQVIFKTAAELIDHCCEHRDEPHAIYWRSEASSEHAMVFFLADGTIILGVSTPADDSDRVDNISNEFIRHFGTEEIIVTYEDCPPELETGFRELFASLPRIPEDISAEAARQTRAHRPIRGEQDAPSNGGHAPV